MKDLVRPAVVETQRVATKDLVRPAVVEATYVSPRQSHEPEGFEECSLFNSGHAYRDGYSIIKCVCGWKSIPAMGHKALVALFALHVDAAKDA